MGDLQHIFAFGFFELDESRCELWKQGVPAEIHATPLRLLLYLVQNRDRPVSKRELLDRVWSDCYVGESAELQALRVVARTSAFAFKGSQEDIRSIGSRLAVGTVVEGSVRAQGNRLRIIVQAIRVGDGDRLWSACYDRKCDDVLDLQEQIAHEIAAALSLSEAHTKICDRNPRRFGL